MILIGWGLLYLAIVKKFEPLLLCGIAFGCILTNLPMANMYHQELWTAFMNGEIGYGDILHDGGLLDFFYIGVKTSIYPCLIFLGVGAMTDFGPLLSNPKSLLLGAAAQMGVFAAFFGAILLGFEGQEAGSDSGIDEAEENENEGGSEEDEELDPVFSALRRLVEEEEQQTNDGGEDCEPAHHLKDFADEISGRH